MSRGRRAGLLRMPMLRHERAGDSWRSALCLALGLLVPGCGGSSSPALVSKDDASVPPDVSQNEGGAGHAASGESDAASPGEEEGSASGGARALDGGPNDGSSGTEGGDGGCGGSILGGGPIE